MSIIQSIRDRVTVQKLKEMIFELYPQFKYVRIKHNGEIILKKHWYSLRRDRISSFKLCTDPYHLPERIIDYARHRLNEDHDIENLLKHIVSVRCNDTYPIIDMLYCEFIQIKYADIWLKHNLSIEPIKPITASMLVRMSKKEKLPWFIKQDIENVIRELHKNLIKNRYLPVTTNQ